MDDGTLHRETDRDDGAATRENLSSVLTPTSGQKKTGCSATEDGLRLEILDKRSRGIVLSMSLKTGAYQPRGN